jgi:hypothetical protein
MTRTKMFVCCAVAAVAALSVHAQASAATVTPGPSTDPWNGYMNVFELPANGGGWVFGQVWGIPDLDVTFDDPGSKLTFGPATIDDPDPFWYSSGAGAPGAVGNKNMEALLYVESTGPLAGQTVDFTFNTLSDTTTSAHEGFAFIKDLAPDYSSSVDTIVALTGGPQTVSYATINDPARHIQYGFRMLGVNIWPGDEPTFGNFMIGTIPEPTSIVLAGLGLIGMLGVRRKRA